MPLHSSPVLFSKCWSANMLAVISLSPWPETNEWHYEHMHGKLSLNASRPSFLYCVAGILLPLPLLLILFTTYPTSLHATVIFNASFLMLPSSHTSFTFTLCNILMKSIMFKSHTARKMRMGNDLDNGKLVVSKCIKIMLRKDQCWHDVVIWLKPNLHPPDTCPCLPFRSFIAASVACRCSFLALPPLRCDDTRMP